MATDGGRADRAQDFDSLQWASINLACTRLSHAFGFGPSWSMPTIEMRDWQDGGEATDQSSALAVRWRGRRKEGAMRASDGGTRCKQFHAWGKARGVVSLPYVAPDPLAQAAVAFGNLRGPLQWLLFAYALQDAREWAKLEPVLHSVLHCQHRTWAGRDALARIMYGRALYRPAGSRGRDVPRGALTIERRARDLGIDVKVYRAATQAAEAILRRWLVTAADRYNAAADAKGSPMGASQGNGMRTETWWHPDRPFLSLTVARTEQFLNANRLDYLKAA